jgi:hypothetical protein
MVKNTKRRKLPNNKSKTTKTTERQITNEKKMAKVGFGLLAKPNL